MAYIEYPECGRIINTHGCRGGIKVEPWCDSPAVFAALKTVYIKKGETLTPVRVHRAAVLSGRFVSAELEGVTTMEAADALRGTVLYAKRSDLGIKKGALLVAEMIGLPVFDKESGKAIADYISIHDEVVDLEPEEMVIFNPTEPWKRQTLHNVVLKPLLVPIFEKGKKVYESPDIEEIKAFCAQQIDTLWDEIKRLEYPHIYYVDYSEKLWLEQMRLLNEKQNG